VARGFSFARATAFVANGDGKASTPESFIDRARDLALILPVASLWASPSKAARQVRHAVHQRQAKTSSSHSASHNRDHLHSRDRR
jgi:hypothetical protein